MPQRLQAERGNLSRTAVQRLAELQGIDIRYSSRNYPHVSAGVTQRVSKIFPLKPNGNYMLPLQ
jgi:hypothetical protein